MQVHDIVDQLKLKVYAGKRGIQNEVSGAYTSDLLSDVMGNIEEGQVWITLQTHQNIMAVSSLKDAVAILIVKGLKPNDEALKQSDEEGIPILGTDLETFEISGLLYQLLNK